MARTKPMAGAWRSAAVACVALAVGPAVARADIIANFTDGNGTTSPDQWTGTAGAGWATAWGSAATTTGTGVVNASPLNAGGSYLQIVDDAANNPAYVRRQYQSAGNVSTAQPHRITMSWRYDGNPAQFTTFNDRVAIFGDTAAQNSSAATNTWLIGVAASNTGAGAGQSVFPGEWYFFDNNGSNAFGTANMFDTNLPLVAGRVYAIAIDVDPATGTYGASINDGVNPAVSAANLTFRRGAGAAASNWVHVSSNSDVATDTAAFSVDSVQIVPEPSAAVGAVVAGAAGLLARRRRRA